MYFSELNPRAATTRLARLMELYESNYLLVRLLVPDLMNMHGEEFVSHQPDCIDLRLKVLERCKYTTTINLTYCFPPESDKNLEPDLTIRIYHDARTAEAMSGLIHGVRHEQRRVRDLDQGWVLNRFLYKWLRYCLYRKHSFAGDSMAMDCPRTETCKSC